VVSERLAVWVLHNLGIDDHTAWQPRWLVSGAILVALTAYLSVWWWGFDVR
jgi:hypothetical protein